MKGNLRTAKAMVIKMKKALYLVLILAEAVLGFLAFSLAWTNLSWIPCVITAAVWALLFVRQILQLIKAPDAEHKQKIRRRIVLVMLIPLLGFLMMFVYWFLDLAMAI